MSQLDLSNIIQLSSLEVSPENQSKFSDQIADILKYMDVLNNVTAKPKTKFEWPIHASVTERDDVASNFEHSLIEKNAPDFFGHSFVVPKILADE